MKKISFAFVGCILLGACSSTPVLVPYITKGASQGNPSEMAIIWADNSTLSYMLIEKVDGKRAPSNLSEGLRYSVAVSPGTHTLNAYLREINNNNPYLGGQYANIELEIEAVAGHSYALRFRTQGSRVQAYLADLGPSLKCRYEIAGGMTKGYVPVQLKCE